MTNEVETVTPRTVQARYLTDREMAPQTGLSVGFLQKDRRTAQLIPYIKVGGKCLYDPPAVFDAMKSLERGGINRRRGHGRR